MKTWKKLAVISVLFLCAASSQAQAIEVEITPFYGYRFGDDFNNFQNSLFSSLEVESAASYGLYLDFAWDYFVLDLMYSTSETQLDAKGGVLGGMKLFDMTQDIWQVSGQYAFNEPGDTARPFVQFGIGQTHFSPDASGVSSETQFSFNLGGGAKFYFSDHIGIRVQGLWIPTYIGSSSSGYYCGFYGCWTAEDYHYLYQWEFTAGLVIKFGEN